MKKVFTILAAAVAALSLASCNKEEILAEQPTASEIKLNITVGNLDGTADTKAIKTGWTAGDKINVWYDRNVTQNPDLVIVYDGAAWDIDATATVSGATPSAEGKLNAIYVQGGLSQFSAYENESDPDYYTASFSTAKTSFNLENSTIPEATSLVSFVGKSAYTFESETLTVELVSWRYMNNVQIVISDIPDGNWALKCDKLRPFDKIRLVNGDVWWVYSDSYYVLSTANDDGKAFMFNTYLYGDVSDFKFTLYDLSSGNEWNYSVSGKSLDESGKLNAIKIPFNKFQLHTYVVPEIVDLGLSVNWASWNLGAKAPEEYGDYFQWAGYHDVSNSNKPLGVYGINAPYSIGDSSEFTKYNRTDNMNVLTPDDDAAHLLLGGDWRIPTHEECGELFNNCSWEYTTINGVYGCKIQSNIAGYTDKWIFLPAAGWCYGPGFTDKDSKGYYWSATRVPNIVSYAYIGIYFSETYHGRGENTLRYNGLPIRPVCAK